MTEKRADFDTDTPIDHNFHQDPGAKVRRWEATLPAEYWDYRRDWEEFPKNRVVGQSPIHLDVEATSNCNLKCTMCPRTEMVDDGTFWRVAEFDFDLYKELIDEGVNKGLRSIKYQYLGEPTMNRRLVEMVEYAKTKGVLDVMFNTNATLLTERLSRRLIASGLDKLFFSFDSPNKAHYEKIRVNANYDKVMKNIIRFHEIRDEMGSVKPFTRVSMVVMQENRHEFEEFRKLFEPIVDAVAHLDYLDHSSQRNPENGTVELGARKGAFCCPQLWQRMFVHPDGVATVCCLDSNRELRVGNVNEQSVEEIWTGEEYQRLRDLHVSGRIDEVPTCSRCPLAKY